MKVIFTILILLSVASANELRDWCNDSEDYFNQHCPIAKGDYNGCCLCTQVRSSVNFLEFWTKVFVFQYYYYSCECCKDVVDAIGVMGDCTQWGTPTGNDPFCYMKQNE